MAPVATHRTIAGAHSQAADPRSTDITQPGLDIATSTGIGNVSLRTQYRGPHIQVPPHSMLRLPQSPTAPLLAADSNRLCEPMTSSYVGLSLTKGDAHCLQVHAAGQFLVQNGPSVVKHTYKQPGYPISRLHRLVLHLHSACAVHWTDVQWEHASPRGLVCG